MLQEWIAPLPPLETLPRIGGQRVGVCPICEQIDLTEKVSSLARRHSGTIYLPDSTEELSFTTGLGRSLSFPSPPRPVSVDWMFTGVLFSWVIATVIMLGIIVLRSQNEVSVPVSALDVATFATLGWFGLAVPLWLIRRYVVDVYRARVDRPAWVAARDRWERLYYCARDDVVFMRDDLTAVPPEHLDSLIDLKAIRAE